MSVYQMIFSPTGGTGRAAELLLRPWGTEAVLIDLTDAAADYRQYHFGPEDICLAAVPSYGGRVPEIAVTRLAQMTGGGARAVLLAVYGNRAYEDTLLELRDTLTAAGFRPAAAAAAVAEHSIMRQFGAGRPDAADERMLVGFGQRIKQVLDEDDAAELRLPGSKPYRDYGGVPFTPKAGKRCTKCGLCAAKCPVGAIDQNNPAAVNQAACISCMRCVAICPQQARTVSRLKLAIASRKLKSVCAGRKENALFI